MKHGSLFSGIGGFDLAAEWMGWDNIFHCECNPFGQKVLKHHFPKSISYHDITKTDFSIHRGEIDILTGGFPCQPYSTAGLRKGKADERHLFPQMLRAIKEIKPKWIIGENVRGLVSWGGGLVFNEVCDDLEREGYEVQAFLIPAAGVNAPHQRQRVWFIAYANDKGRSTKFGQIQGKDGEISEWNDYAEFSNTNFSNDAINSNLHNDKSKVGGINEEKNSISQEHRSEYNTSREFSGTNIANDATNTSCEGLQRRPNFNKWEKHNKERSENGIVFRANCKNNKQYFKSNFSTFPSEPPICGGDDGLSKELDNITFSKWRNESIKAYGNAIVPQVVYEIFKTIQIIEDGSNKPT